MRSDYKIYDPGGVYTITSTIVEWIPIFTSKPYFEILINSMQFCQTQKNLKIYAYVILLLEFYKKKHKRDSQYQLWQEGFHPQQIMSDDMFRQKVKYIHYNPVKRGYVESPEYWYYSSAGDFLLNRSGIIQLDPVPL